MAISGVLDGYFDVMGIPLVEGRGFTSADVADAPLVAVVNQSLADEYWPGTSALNRRVRRDRDQEEADPWVTVIGVARNVRHQRLDVPAEPKLYVPALQTGRYPHNWVLRVPGDPAPAIQQARSAVAEVSAATPVRRTLILDERIARSVAIPRFRTLFVVGLGTLATVLALLGVYGVVAFAVSQRTRELAVRIALGARPANVVARTLASGLWLCGGGLVLGLLIAAAGARILESFLYRVESTDSVTYAAAAALVAVVGVAAAYLPARRAASVDPVSVLNSE